MAKKEYSSKDGKKKQETKSKSKKSSPKTAYQHERDQYKTSTKAYKKKCRENAQVIPRRLPVAQ